MTGRPTPIQMLPWDSDFFGIPIARVVDGGPPSIAVTEAQTARVECLYLEIPAGQETSRAAAEAAGFVGVETRVLLARPLPGQPMTSVDSVAVEKATAEDVDGLGACLDVLAPWSRFAVDPRFGVAAARRMYDIWARRAWETAGSEVLVARIGTEDEVAGCITIEGDEPDIGLLSVVRPGRGIGTALLSAAINVAVSAGQPELTVKTQGRNDRALAIYRDTGFAERDRTLVMHWWRSA